MNTEQLEKDIAELEAGMQNLATEYNKLQEQLKELSNQANDLNQKSEAVKVQFGQDNAVLNKLRSYLPSNVVKEENVKTENVKTEDAK